MPQIPTPEPTQAEIDALMADVDFFARHVQDLQEMVDFGFAVHVGEDGYAPTAPGLRIAATILSMVEVMAKARDLPWEAPGDVGAAVVLLLEELGGDPGPLP